MSEIEILRAELRQCEENGSGLCDRVQRQHATIAKLRALLEGSIVWIDAFDSHNPVKTLAILDFLKRVSDAIAETGME